MDPLDHLRVRDRERLFGRGAVAEARQQHRAVQRRPVSSEQRAERGFVPCLSAHDLAPLRLLLRGAFLLPLGVENGGGPHRHGGADSRRSSEG